MKRYLVLCAAVYLSLGLITTHVIKNVNLGYADNAWWALTVFWPWFWQAYTR
jgi:hypothetical protein